MFDYESHRSEGENYLYVQQDENLCFRLHMHNSFEFVVCLSGQIEIAVDKDVVALGENQCMLLPPLTAHSYNTKTQSKTFLCVFSRALVADYCAKHKNQTPENPIFALDDAGRVMSALKDDNLFARKSALYEIVAAQEKSTEFAPSDKREASIIHSLVGYVEENCAENITLKSVAKTLGYSYNYLSGKINDLFGCGFSELLNNYRISKAHEMLEKGDKKITEIAEMCGYDSIRTFNRNYLRVEGCPPRTTAKPAKTTTRRQN